MSVPIPSKKAALLIVAVSFLVQLGFALGIFGPAWLSPVLTLPALAALAGLWHGAEKRRRDIQAFTEFVI